MVELPGRLACEGAHGGLPLMIKVRTPIYYGWQHFSDRHWILDCVNEDKRWTAAFFLSLPLDSVCNITTHFKLLLPWFPHYCELYPWTEVASVKIFLAQRQKNNWEILFEKPFDYQGGSLSVASLTCGDVTALKGNQLLSKWCPCLQYLTSIWKAYCKAVGSFASALKSASPSVLGHSSWPLLSIVCATNIKLPEAKLWHLGSSVFKSLKFS